MRKTHVIIVLDRSYSMDDKPGKKKRTLSDYNEQVSMCQEFDGNEQEVTVSFVSYAHDCYEHLWKAEAKELKTLTMEEYECNGGTALQDALMYVYQKAEETIIPSLAEEDALLIQVLTDGEENSSQKFRGAAGAAEVGKLGKKLEDTGKVTITFMGADRKVVEEAAEKYNIPLANCAIMNDDDAGSLSFAYSNRSARNRQYFTSRSVAKGMSAGPVVTACSNFMSDDGAVADWSQVDDSTGQNSLDKNWAENKTGDKPDIWQSKK